MFSTRTVLLFTINCEAFVLIQLFQSLMVEKTYKHRPRYLIAKKEEEEGM